MTFLFIAALILAWPTAGLSLVAFVVLLVVRGYLKAKERMHYADVQQAKRDVVNGADRLPSWVGDETEQEVFLYALRSAAHRKGIPAQFVDRVLNDKQSFTKLIQLAGAMEAGGSSFIEQQMAVLTTLEQQWDEQKHLHRPMKQSQHPAQARDGQDVQATEARLASARAEGARQAREAIGERRVPTRSTPATPSPQGTSSAALYDSMRAEVEALLKTMKIRVQLVVQGGRILWTSDELTQRPAYWMGGDVLEVMFKVQGREPYFVYYQNPDYYSAMAMGGNGQGGATAEQYRASASQALAKYLVLLQHAQGVDITHASLSFSHNRIHTNVLAWVELHRNWYPIRHSGSEDDADLLRVVAAVNSGEADISDHIALHDLSPA